MKKTLLITSILLNVFLIGFIAKRAYYANKKPKIEAYKHPGYFLNRQNYYKVLSNDKDEIVFVGDSHIQYFALQEMFKDLRIKNRGIAGDITKGVLGRLDEVTESKPKKVFIEVGVNDVLEGVPTDTTVSNIEAIIERIKEASPATKIYLHSLLPTKWRLYNSETRALPAVIDINKRLPGIASKAGATFINTYDAFLGDNGLKHEYDCGDSIHLTGKGYLKWKEILDPYIKD